MRILANILSVLLHPLWMPALTFWLVLTFDRSVAYTMAPDGRWILLAMVFAMTALFPLTSALVMLRNRMIASLTVPERRERIPMFVMTWFYYGMCYYLLRRTGVNDMLLNIFFGALLALSLTLLITLRWKISVHMVGIGGLVGALAAILVKDDAPVQLALVLGCVSAGALGSARLVASDHTPAQVYAGAGLGALCVWCMAFWGWSI